MAFPVYVTDYEDGTTLEELIIYFQSKAKSGGGDVDEEKCYYDKEEAVIVFDGEEGKMDVVTMKEKAPRLFKIIHKQVKVTEMHDMHSSVSNRFAAPCRKYYLTPRIFQVAHSGVS